jgi:Protein of unknown function (DUF3570)
MAWAEVAVAATEAQQRALACTSDGAGTRNGGTRLLAAVLALPGVLHPAPACAEDPPEKTTLSFKLLNYQDQQPGLKRVQVRAPALMVSAPVASKWSVEASAVHDEVSGASPRYYSDVSGASRMRDERNAFAGKVTRYFERAAVGVGVSSSKEHDYRSRAVSIDARWSSADHNTAWNAGLGHASDRIDPVNQIVTNERRRSTDLVVGVTQAWSQRDLVQASLTLGQGRGYYNDPYKLYDERPRTRRQQIGLLRWNHRLTPWPATLRGSYRYYQDSFGIRAHTVDAVWVQPVAPNVTIEPLLRYYTQRAARFYYDPVADPAVYPAPLGTPTFMSTDQRLSAFGAITWGLKLVWQVTPQWSTDLKLERYEQRSGWRLGGQGSPGLAPFTATWLQFGLTSTF